MKITKYETQRSNKEVRNVRLHIEFERKDEMPNLQEEPIRKFFENVFQDKLRWWQNATILFHSKGATLTIERKMLKARGWITHREQLEINSMYAVIYPNLRDALIAAKKRFTKQTKK